MTVASNASGKPTGSCATRAAARTRRGQEAGGLSRTTPDFHARGNDRGSDMHMHARNPR